MKFLNQHTFRLRIPGWVLPLFMAPFCEILVHVWTAEQIIFARLAAAAVFGLGFGCVLGFACALVPSGASKWAAEAAAFVLAFVYMGEYLIYDSFHVFMAPDTVAAGAAGVFSDYMPIVLDEIVTHLPHIFLLLLPMIAFGILAKPVDTGWGARGCLAAMTVVSYVAAVTVVVGVNADVHRFRDSYNFDSAVRCFGLHTAFVLDGLNDAELVDKELEFTDVEIPPPATQVTQATEPSEPASTGDPDDTQETQEPTEPPVIYFEHTLGLDFAALAREESNSDIATLHGYVAGQTPAMENEYTGLFRGKNLIFITAEAFSGAIISQELTPTLYRLANQGIRFTDYYQPTWGASTTGGEYSNLLGLVPKGGSCMKEAYQQTLFLTIGNQLRQQGYSSAAFHNNSYTYYDRNKTHTCLGYDYFMGYGNGIEKGVRKNWPQSDLEMMEYTVDLYIDQQPFSVYYMTVSGHCEYNRDNDMGSKNYSLVKDLPYSETLKYYIACQLELEAALTVLLNRLEEAGILDDTVIVLATDHYPYGLDVKGDTYLKELMGVSQIDDFTRDQNTLIIWSGCIEGMDIVVDEPVMSLDILPTLSNLFGVPYDSRLMVGRDVFCETEPLVFWSISGSWKTALGTYHGETGVFTPNEGVTVDSAYVDYINALVSNKLRFCEAVAAYNYYNYVYDALQAKNPGSDSGTG